MAVEEPQRELGAKRDMVNGRMDGRKDKSWPSDGQKENALIFTLLRLKRIMGRLPISGTR